MHAIGRGVSFKLFKVVGQVGDGVHLGAAGHFPQGFPFGHGMCHAVALLAHEVERPVVPGGAFAVGNEFPGSLCV